MAFYLGLHLESDVTTISKSSEGFDLGGGAVSLLVGADGYRSVVREQMEKWDGEKGSYVVKPPGYR